MSDCVRFTGGMFGGVVSVAFGCGVVSISVAFPILSVTFPPDVSLTDAGLYTVHPGGGGNIAIQTTGFLTHAPLSSSSALQYPGGHFK